MMQNHAIIKITMIVCQSVNTFLSYRLMQVLFKSVICKIIQEIFCIYGNRLNVVVVRLGTSEGY